MTEKQWNETTKPVGNLEWSVWNTAFAASFVAGNQPASLAADKALALYRQVCKAREW